MTVTATYGCKMISDVDGREEKVMRKNLWNLLYEVMERTMGSYSHIEM